MTWLGWWLVGAGVWWWVWLFGAYARIRTKRDAAPSLAEVMFAIVEALVAWPVLLGLTLVRLPGAFRRAWAALDAERKKRASK